MKRAAPTTSSSWPRTKSRRGATRLLYQSLRPEPRSHGLLCRPRRARARVDLIEAGTRPPSRERTGAAARGRVPIAGVGAVGIHTPGIGGLGALSGTGTRKPSPARWAMKRSATFRPTAMPSVFAARRGCRRARSRTPSSGSANRRPSPRDPCVYLPHRITRDGFAVRGRVPAYRNRLLVAPPSVSTAASSSRATMPALLVPCWWSCIGLSSHSRPDVQFAGERLERPAQRLLH